MKRIHTPVVDARYWLAIIFASIFGTNLGDLCAHDSGLALIPGLAVLAVLALAVFWAERVLDSRRHEAYYWIVIVIIRTGATNIADGLAFRLRIAPLILLASLAAVMAAVAWRWQRSAAATAAAPGPQLPDTDAAYWIAMLAAGVFGTVLGDVCSHQVGQGLASIGLTAIFSAVLLARRAATIGSAGMYWLIVGAARSAGTAIGDWLAENKWLHIGLPLSTMITGLLFVAIVIFVPRHRRGDLARSGR